MNITMEKAALIDLLAKNVIRAEQEDAKALESHRAKEQAALKKFRDACRDAISWDYKKAKANYLRPKSVAVPSCPASEAKRIKETLKMVRMCGVKKLSFKENSDIGVAALWLPKSERGKRNMCD